MAICKHCNGTFTDTEFIFTCNLCQIQYHNRKDCSGIQASLIKEANKHNGQVRLLCRDCKEFDLATMYAKMIDMERRLKRLEERQPIIRNPQTAHQNDNMATVVEECTERIKKLNNIIIFNTDESKIPTVDEDVKLAKEILTSIELPNVKIMSAKKLGVKTNNKKRPLLIKCETYDDKIKVLQNSNKLRIINTNNKISIKPDLTKLQQSEQKALYTEFKTRKEDGEDIIIKKGKIVAKPPFKNSTN